ncbi:MAG: DEAD/DEAH box helicase [Haliscomenobacteraceae bacterium CHB4]|nr:DEAD/DEAH box helicase [Haliscomenobacteraceae bacterium CHB4]
MDFSEFGFYPDLLDGIEALNFKTATPIQEQAIPLILEGRDLIGIAQTGTGKTAAFVLPILQKILESNESHYTQALIIVPTRELAMQIDQAIGAYSYFAGISSIAIYGGGGGKDFAQGKEAITGGTDIIIATPGRLLAHMNLGYVNFSRLRFLVLDEADRMLDMGFMPDLNKIIKTLNPNRQSLLFSATMPQGVMKLAKTLLRDPATVSIALSKPAEGVTQAAYLVHERQKLPLIADILKDKVGQRILVFCSSKLAVGTLYKQLRAKGMNVGQISSDLEQEEREKVMLAFRNRQVDIIVATDVLSRGIDVEGIDLVINYDVPRDAEDYVHRIGRTARAARKGAALTLVSHADLIRLKRIEKLIGNEVPKIAVPAHIGAVEERERSGRKPPHKAKSRNAGSGEKQKTPATEGQERPKKRHRGGRNRRRKGGGEKSPAA